MGISKDAEDMLLFAKERIVKEINDTFMIELHINGRMYENKPSKHSKEHTTDDEIILLIDSYVSHTIDKIIHANTYDC